MRSFQRAAAFAAKEGVLDGAAPDDDAEDAGINSFFDIVHGADAAARLDGDGDGFADGADEGRIHALSFEGAVKVDDVKEFRARLPRKRARFPRGLPRRR